jgi:hypothetical protein
LPLENYRMFYPGGATLYGFFWLNPPIMSEASLHPISIFYLLKYALVTHLKVTHTHMPSHLASICRIFTSTPSPPPFPASIISTHFPRFFPPRTSCPFIPLIYPHSKLWVQGM